MQKTPKSYAALDIKSRNSKSRKITAILEKFKSLKSSNVLDIGTGSGHIASQLSSKCKSVISVDINDERKSKKGYKFLKIKGEKLLFPDNSFDIVVSNHVVEHIKNQQKHMDEIYRVLKKGGVCYLATPNKYWPIDPHTKIPFSSYLPKALTGKNWGLYPLSYQQIRKLSKKFFKRINITPHVMKNPERYSIKASPAAKTAIKILPKKVLNFIAPTYILVLVK